MQVAISPQIAIIWQKRPVKQQDQVFTSVSKIVAMANATIIDHSSRTTTTNSAIITSDATPTRPQQCHPPGSAFPCRSKLFCLNYLTQPRRTTIIATQATTTPRVLPFFESTSFEMNDLMNTTPNEVSATDVRDYLGKARSRAR